MSIKYFHELSDTEFNILFEKNLTWGDISQRYPQPVWCGYHEAVLGEWGCWSLVGKYGPDRRIRSVKDCKGCDALKVVIADPPIIKGSKQ